MKVLSKVARQGDVDIFKVDKLPEGLTKMKGKILQESETTGHHHHFKPDASVSLYQTLEVPVEGKNTITPDLGKFIVVDGEAILYHGKGFDTNPALLKSGDHDALTLKDGIYQISITQEYDYAKGVARKVVD